MSSDPTVDFPHDPWAFEAWRQTPYIRWATMMAVPTAPKILQVLWQSDSGRQRWEPVETVFVSQAEYEQTPQQKSTTSTI